MRSYFSLFIILLVTSAFGFAGKTKPPAPTTDPEYTLALSAADHFLQAWETRDYESGVIMLTDAAKQSVSEMQLDELFGAEKKGERGYEVVHGKKLRPGKYEFPVTLFEYGRDRKASPRSSRLVVIQEGKNEWVIDQLP